MAEQRQPSSRAGEGKGHPLLRWRSREEKGAYTHRFSAGQVQALGAMCGAIVPSLPPEKLADGRGGKEEPPSKPLEKFWLASAGDSPVPEEVAELIATKCLRDAVLLMNIMLWLLSTRLGTLLCCGSLCLRWDFPFVDKLVDMPVTKREMALQRWSSAGSVFLLPLRITFILVKLLTCYVFYSMLNENSENPSWRAIGYTLPSDAAQEDQAAETERPLDQGIIESKYLDDTSLLKAFADKGLAVVPDLSDNVYHIKCDAVVVGSGCGGGVAAARLAQAGYKVVIVEKGEYFTSKDYTSIEGPAMEHLYENGGVLSTADVSMLVFAGSTVGGGTAVNWSACIRTPDHVLDEWTGRGLPVFSRESFSGAMDAVWSRLCVTGNCVKEGFQNMVLRRGCEKLGLDIVSVARNSSDRHYCGSCCFGCPTGEKCSVDMTWLVDAVRHGAVIITGCKAQKFLMEDNNGKKFRCKGLMARSLSCGVTKKLVFESKISIAACGAMSTPPLLRASGLKNDHIGRNLHLHPAMMAWGYFPETVLDLEGSHFEGGIITCMHKIPRDNGDAKGEVIIEAPALGPAAFASLIPWVSGADMKDRMRRYARTAHLFALVRDSGSGTVDGPLRSNYHVRRKDREALKHGLRTALRILVAAGAMEIGTHRSDGPRFRCTGARERDVEAFLDEVCRDDEGPYYSRKPVWCMSASAHQMGSCRMASCQEEGAVDTRGETWEAEGLYVCDGSVLPTAVGVNPMVTIQAVAYRLADGMAAVLAGMAG